MLSDFKSCGSFKTDIKETPDKYVVHAELAEVKKEDINIDYNNNYLSISATRNNESEEKKDNYIKRESSYKTKFCNCFLLKLSKYKSYP